jgi:prepilin-type N-terminal cleavage/methylation domain-containing protein
MTHPRRAFTLIEILIAVLILALGLLGLGAVFPAVIREQRIGADALNGAQAAAQARAVLLSWDYNGAMNPPPPPPPPPAPQPPPRDFWRNWRDSAATGGLNRVEFEHGEFFVPAIDLPGAQGASPSSTEMGIPGSIYNSFSLPLRERLFPFGPQAQDPHLVWDIAVHRLSDAVPGNPASNDPVQVVLFVRRVDPRLRVPRTQTLYQQFIASGAARRVPVGIVAATGLPTLDGTGTYAPPITIPVRFHSTLVRPDRDRLYFETGGLGTLSAAQWAIVSQIGQKLVDNLGTVHSVVGFGEDPMLGHFVKIDPPVPAFISENQAAPSAASGGVIQQVVLTPQVPVAVSVFTVVNP